MISVIAVALIISIVLPVSGPANAETYPTRPVRLITPGTPGSATDVRIRWIAPKLSAALGQTIVVDNRPGAGGTIGTELAAKSKPDGYTLLQVHQGTLAFTPHIYSRLGYDALTSFAPISRIGTSPLVLAVTPSFTGHTVSDLLQLARKKPGALNYGSPGSGSPPHVAGELFRRMANIDVAHVPYKGGAAALLDLAAGRVTYTFDSPSVQMPYARSGKIKALAVTGATRIGTLADIPTIAESGLPGYDYSAWQGIAAPSGTPREVILRLNAEIVNIMNSPEARQWFGEQGIEPLSDTPEQFAAYIKTEHARWGPIIREAAIKVD